MERFVWICVAGAAGTGARYLISAWAAARFGAAFPYGTLLVNLAGCYAIAAVIYAATVQAWPSTLRTTLTVGFLGGFTTYSSFNYETTRLIEEGAAGTALLNVGATLFGCLIAGWLGMMSARVLLGTFR